MRVVAIFRGFPGLGRVVAGMELLSLIQKKFSAEIQIYSYIQGAAYARSLGFPVNETTDSRDISSIGIVPVSRYGETIIERIINWPADLVIIDGEPLLVHALKLVNLKCKIIVLLNPFDVENPFITRSTQSFFNDCYSKSDIALIHGLIEIKPPPEYIHFHSLPTILRSNVINLEPGYSENKVSCVLGGGTENAAESFLNSTLSICHTCIEMAEIIHNYMFHIYCGSQSIADALTFETKPGNVQIHASLGSALELYSTSKVIITRAGRNTLSEILFLGMPAISFAVSDPHRGSEQKANLKAISSLARNIITNLDPLVSAEILAENLMKLVGKQTQKGDWKPGNFYLEQIIADL